MKRNSLSRSIVTAAIAMSAVGSIAWAQHAISAKFDDKAPLEISGIVTNVDWRNPQETWRPTSCQRAPKIPRLWAFKFP